MGSIPNIRARSYGPILDSQTWYLTKVRQISGEQERIAGQHNSRNFHVHRPDAQARATQPLEDCRRRFIEGQDRDPSVIVQMLEQPMIGSDMLRR